MPARNEENTLAAALDALAMQHGVEGGVLDDGLYEVIVLLNNCTDDSAGAARAWQAAHADFPLHVAECVLVPERAHVGWARRLLMDTAWNRLRDGSSGRARGILSTDADTLVEPDWIAANLAALDAGADAVGGVINVKQGEYAGLSEGVQQAYRQDRQYQLLIAQLEDLLDPQAGDAWPRHLEHFGASLACTPEAYARAGGVPAVKALEDMAFVDALRRSGARLRHDPAVRVATSARLNGRAEIGLSYQLRVWHEMSESGRPHRVGSAEALEHRFRTLRDLRKIFAGCAVEQLRRYPNPWPERIAQARQQARSEAEFLLEMDCDRMIEQTGPSAREGEISGVNRNLAHTILRLQADAAATARPPAESVGRGDCAAVGINAVAQAS